MVVCALEYQGMEGAVVEVFEISAVRVSVDVAGTK